MFILETVVILLISFFINFTVSGLFASPKFDGKEILLSNVGEFLGESLGNFSTVLWGFGLLASGLSSTTTGALAGQYLMEGIFDFRISKIKRAIITRYGFLNILIS